MPTPSPNKSSDVAEGTSLLSGKRLLGAIIFVALATVALLSHAYDASRNVATRANDVDLASEQPPPINDDEVLSSSAPGYIEHLGMDTAPGSGDIKEIEGVYAELRECAAVCDKYATSLLSQCNGFVVRKDLAPPGKIKCFFKRKYFSGVPHAPVDSYFRPMRFVKSAPRLPIVYGVLTAKKFLRTRLWAAYETWLHDAESVVFLEDKEDVREAFNEMQQDTKRSEHLKNVVTAAAFLKEPANSTVRAFNGAWKNLPILQHLSQSHPDSPWYAMVDDDSFIAQHNMNILLSTSYRNHAQLFYIGVTYNNGAGGLPFQQGGAGVVYNNVAMKQFLTRYDSCVDNCLEYAGDIRFGCCAKLTSVPISMNGAFWSQTVFRALGRDARAKESIYPVSFHTMRNQTWVKDLHHAMSVVGGEEQLDESCKLDMFSTTKTCRLRRRRRIVEVRKRRGLPLPVDEATRLFDWGTGNKDAFQLVPTQPITWDFLEAQFRQGWRDRYSEDLYTK